MSAELPKPSYSHGSGDIPAYSAAQMSAFRRQAIEECISIAEDTRENTRYDAIQEMKRLLK